MSQPDNIKAGRRHSEADMTLGRKLKSMAGEIAAGMDVLGFTEPEPPPAEWTPEAAEKALVFVGAEVKALGDGKVGGYLVRFSGPNDPDLTGDFFTTDTDFGDHDTAPILYQHGLDTVLKSRVLGRGKLRRDGVGVWVEAQLQLRDDYEKAIYELAEAGKLGWSSGTAGHLVEREPAGKGYRIKSWPLGLDASLTPTPAEPRNAAMTLKAYVDSLQPAEQPAPNGAQVTPSASEITVSDVQPKQERTQMSDEVKTHPEMTAEFEKLMAAIGVIGEAVKSVKTDVDAMKTAPAERTGGVAQAIEAKQAPAHLKGAKEALADEQLSALKAYLRNEMGRDEWKASQRKLEQDDAQINQAFKNLTHAMRDGGRAEAAYNSLANDNAYIKASLVEGTASLGGNLVPQLYSNQVIGKLKEDSIVRRSGAYVFPVTGGYKFQVPTITRSGSAPLATELAAGSQMEPTFGAVDFQAYAYRAQYIASREQVLDSRVPLDSLLMENAAWQITQSENNHLVIGTGTNQPQGIAAAASTLGLSPGSTLALAFPDGRAGGNLLADIYHGLPYQYRDNAVWFMNDATIAVIRKLRDGSGAAASLGNFLWQPGLQAGQPDRILGRPVITANNMATTGSSATVIAFGDPRFFWIADFNNGGLDFQILNELYAASAAVGWWFWKRFDSRLLVSEAVVGMKLLS